MRGVSTPRKWPAKLLHVIAPFASGGAIYPVAHLVPGTKGEHPDVDTPFAQLRAEPGANTPETLALSVIRKAGPSVRSPDREADRGEGTVQSRSFLSFKAESARAPSARPEIASPAEFRAAQNDATILS
jgi:hypothetical protein